MKSKFTSIIMFFIIIFIIITSGILGMVLWEEFSGALIPKTSEVKDQVELFESSQLNNDEISNIVEENIEVPKIRNSSNPLTELESIEGEEQDTDYKNVIVNKYFYNQLDKNSKIIYNAFEKNKDNMKSGTYKINLGTSFDDILSKEDGQNVLGEYYQSATEAYIYDNPDVFYLDPGKLYLNVETITKGNQKNYRTYIDCGDEENYLIDEFSSQDKVIEAIAEIENVRNKIISKKTGDTYYDIKMVHDYLVDNVEYDTSISKDNIYNVYGALINNECVCEGYAKALKYLLDGLGIESTLVIGKAQNSQGDSENHAWNYVKIDNNWYAIDSTWDDPVVIGWGTIGNDIKYKYFLKGSNKMNEDHFPSGRFTENGKLFKYPNINNSDY